MSRKCCRSQKQLEDLGFTVHRTHWRGPAERGTNDYEGAAVVLGLGTPYLNLGALAERKASMEAWVALWNGAGLSYPEAVELSSAYDEAAGSMLQAQGRNRSTVRPGQSFLQVSIGAEHLGVLRGVVKARRGVHLQRLPEVSLSGEHGQRASLERFSAEADARGLQALTWEGVQDFPAAARPGSKPRFKRWVRKHGQARGWRCFRFPRGGRGHPIEVWAATKPAAKSVL